MKVLLIGGTGLVGSRIVQLFGDSFDLVYPDHTKLDVTNESQVLGAVEQVHPGLILYAGGFTNVDLAEEKQQECFALNVRAVEFLCNGASKLNIPFYYLSTDYVFEGTKNEMPYTEEDEPNPVDSVYAKSKREGELVTFKSALNCVIRLIMPFSAVYIKKMDLARLLLNKLKKGEEIFGIVDQKINPIFVDDLVMGIGKIIEKKASGIYHLGALDYTTPYNFIKELARQFQLPENLIKQITFAEFSQSRLAKRPQNTWLDTSKFVKEFGGGILHTMQEEIKIFKSQVDYLV